MKLADLYRHLYDRAVATGRDQPCDLRGGARLVVRVRAGIVTTTFARKETRLGGTEEITFKLVCEVPAGAERLPAEGQAQRERDGAIWHLVAYRWPIPQPTDDPVSTNVDTGR